MFRSITSTLLVLSALSLLGCPSDSGKAPNNGGADSDGASDGATDGKPIVKAEPFDISKAKTPWKHFKTGDWALYNMIDAKKEMRFEVTEISGRVIKFTVKDNKTGALINDVELDMAEEDERYKDPMTYDGMVRDKDGNATKPYTESVEIKGKTIEALVIKRAGLGSTTELWIAEKDVPPFNQCAVKSIQDGKLRIELLDFGSK